MHRKDGTCYLCKKLNGGDWIQKVEEHHVMYGNADRKLSERYGLKVYLCYEHHRGKKGVHHDGTDLNILLRQEAQKAFMKKYPDKDWMEIFGKNYL